MNGVQWSVLVPIVIYFALMYVIGVWSAKRNRDMSLKKGGTGDAYMEEYMTGGRDTGGFVLAMTLVATYLSAGSFIGGPGTAYTHGLAWVFLAMTQIPTGYYTMMVLGKKFAIVSRKINANSISEFLRARYNSNAVLIIASVSIIFFLIAAMAAQLIGAARLLQGSTGLSYTVALVFFAATVIVHTAIGGFRGVVLNDTMQGVVMTLTTTVLFLTVVKHGGGIEQIVQGMRGIDPGMITPFGVKEGFMTPPWVASYWVLVGFAVVGLPAIASRAMSYKDTKSLNSGIIYGTVVSTVLLLAMHLVGAFSATMITGIESGDLVVPTITTTLFNPVIAGLILSGPLAAVMSTLDSQLLVVVGSIVNDLLVNYIKPELKNEGKKLSTITTITCFVVGIITVMVAFEPPDLMVWLNLFATAGQMSTFLWPTILGLYWKGANATGAIASMISGIGSFIIFNYFLPRPLGLHPIVPALLISLAVFVIVAKLTKPPTDEVIQKFWGV